MYLFQAMDAAGVDEIRIFGVVLHSHVSTQKVRFRHIRFLDFSIAFDIVTGLTSYKNKQIWVRALFSCILCLRILILAYKRSQKFTIVQLYVINSTANPQYFLIYFCKWIYAIKASYLKFAC